MVSSRFPVVKRHAQGGRGGVPEILVDHLVEFRAAAFRPPTLEGSVHWVLDHRHPLGLGTSWPWQARVPTASDKVVPFGPSSHGRS